MFFDRLSVACFKMRVGGEANLFTFFKDFRIKSSDIKT